jgi:hypothetical protein
MSLRARLDVQMRKAFFDVLQHKLVEEPVEAVEWLIRLHGELGERFVALLPSKARDIGDRMDNELFGQQLVAGSYGSAELGPLIHYTWALLRMACSPDMDSQLEDAYEEVAAALVPGAAFSSVVPLYLRVAHGQLDEITRRIAALNALPG